jgi:hypothetical protein
VLEQTGGKDLHTFRSVDFEKFDIGYATWFGKAAKKLHDSGYTKIGNGLRYLDRWTKRHIRTRDRLLIDSPRHLPVEIDTGYGDHALLFMAESELDGEGERTRMNFEEGFQKPIHFEGYLATADMFESHPQGEEAKLR